MTGKIMRNEIIPPEYFRRGRGRLRFPQWLELEVSSDGTKGDCIVYPDTPSNRSLIIRVKCQYNNYSAGQFADYHFTHRYEIHHGEPVLVIQRIV